MLIRRRLSIRHRSDTPLSGRFRRALLAVAGLALMTVAAEAQLQVFPAVEANAATEMKAPRPDFRYSWRISNDGLTPLEGVTVIVRSTSSIPATACANTDRCTLGWRLDGQPLLPNSITAIPLGAAVSHELTFEGRAEDLGLYQSRAIISSHPTPLDIRVRRINGALGDGAVVVGPVGTQTLPFFKGDRTVTTTIANRSEEAVTLSGPLRVRLLRDDGSQTFRNLVWDEDVPCPAVGSGANLPPGGQLSCNVAISRWTGPGRYRMNVSVGGPGIDRVGAPGDFSLRYHWGYAWLVFFVGGLIGAWLDAYLNSARRRGLQLADAQEFSDEAKKARDGTTPAKQPETRAILQKIIDDLDAKMALLRTDRNADFRSELDAVRARLPAIGTFAGLEKEYNDLHQPPAVKPTYEAARDAVSADTLPADAARKLNDLKAAIDAARPRPDPILGVTDVAAEDGGGLFAIVFGPRSSKSLRDWVRRNDRMLAFFAIVLASTIGVVTLWKPNVAWGGIGDIMLAFLIGIGGTISGTLTIKGLVSGYQLRPIPTPQ